MCPEHIETLQEIDIEYREIAEEAGIEGFHRVPALNLHPQFINDMATMVLDALDSPPPRKLFSDVVQPEKRVKIYPQERSAWGMTPVAEVWNGRLAMTWVSGPAAGTGEWSRSPAFRRDSLEVNPGP